MKLTPCGAAGGVTGSCSLLETSRAKVVIDCGLFQGSRMASSLNREPWRFDPRELDAVLLTHAHLDHCGRLPLLAKEGARAPIFATEASVEMAALLLADSARIQEADAERRNRKNERAGRELEVPLYTMEDVELALASTRPLEFDAWQQVAPGMRARWRDAGHILGAASIEIEVEGESPERLVFSGDLGPPTSPLMRASNPPDGADLVVIESTYGDRDHRSPEETIAEFRTLLARAAKERRKVFIPSFAVGRTQRLFHEIATAFEDGAVREMPVYLDSPLAIRATELYQRHADELHPEVEEALRRRAYRMRMPRLKFVEDSEGSRRLNGIKGPCVIIAGSGMCNGGRILHHLKHNLWRHDALLLFVGYQADGTLGARLATGEREVRVLGNEIRVNAEVHTLGGFSAHAGREDLLNWLGRMADSKPRVVVQHGETEARHRLAEGIRERFDLDVSIPDLYECLDL